MNLLCKHHTTTSKIKYHQVVFMIPDWEFKFKQGLTIVRLLAIAYQNTELRFILLNIKWFALLVIKLLYSNHKYCLWQRIKIIVYFIKEIPTKYFLSILFVFHWSKYYAIVKVQFVSLMILPSNNQSIWRDINTHYMRVYKNVYLKKKKIVRYWVKYTNK